MSGSVVPPGRRLHAIVEERAREAPDRVALTAPAGEVTYGELDARADRLAARLRSLGVGPDVLVALCARRSPEAVVGMLGILKAGGAYVPVDPDYPSDRVEHLLRDCGAPVLVAAADCVDAVGGRHPAVLVLDGDDVTGEPQVRVPAPDPPRDPSDRDLAYVIYTSGSTGQPKGVLVEHRNVVRLFEQTRPWFGFDAEDTWSLFHSISFDFSVWEIWGALLHGGRLVLVPERTTRSPALLLALLRSERVTVLNQTPSAFHQLLRVAFAEGADEDLTAGLALRLVVFGGERLEPRQLAPWIERHGDDRPRLVNMYGITETTVHCTYRRITAADLDAGTTSVIGVPIPDLRLDLLDPAGRPVPDGEPGELHVSGGGVTRGYLDRPELTAERFLSAPGSGAGSDAAEGRRYRSGDLAVRLPDGDLAYLGRVDDQLKIRGFRIEPAEVEQCLAQVPGVDRAVVVPRDFGDGDVRLVAHLVPVATAAADPGLPDVVERHARTCLPRHLRPSVYTLVTEIPMTLQGKVDRHAMAK